MFRILKLFGGLKRVFAHSKCHLPEGGLKKVIIVGSPNVGKSVIFNYFTKARATVSNYPGTTVLISRGKMNVDGTECEIIDTPGLYSLSAITEDERQARSIIFREKPQVILQVVDAKNLERMLPLTFQLIEAGFNVVLVLNMMDELVRLGMEIDIPFLEKELNIPVVPTVAIKGKGMEELRRRIGEFVRKADKI